MTSFREAKQFLRNGVLNNVTASFQVHLPPQSPVENITFGFGGPGVIGYIDLNGQFGRGSFTFVPTAAPEPMSAYSLGLALITLFGLRVRRKMNRLLGKARLL